MDVIRESRPERPEIRQTQVQATVSFQTRQPPVLTSLNTTPVAAVHSETERWRERERESMKRGGRERKDKRKWEGNKRGESIKSMKDRMRERGDGGR